jgi:2,5-diketo-D-gluconate reductase B
MSMLATSTVEAAGITVPALGFGTWELEADVAERSVRDALDLGYRHIDTAAMYGNEAAVGAAIRGHDVDRDDVHLTTKVWNDDAKKDDVVRAAEASLERLGLDHVDLLLIHWPTDVAPIEETIEGLEEVRERGLTRAIGVSNYTADQVRRAAKVAPLATNQVEYHPFLSQEAVLEACRDNDMFVTAYSPLAHGMALKDPILNEIAAEDDRGPAEVALRWLLDQPGVAAIPRSSNRDHIAANAGIDFTLTDAQRTRIDALPKNLRQIDPPFAPDWDRV